MVGNASVVVGSGLKAEVGTWTESPTRKNNSFQEGLGARRTQCSGSSDQGKGVA